MYKLFGKTFCFEPFMHHFFLTLREMVKGGNNSPCFEQLHRWIRPQGLSPIQSQACCVAAPFSQLWLKLKLNWNEFILNLTTVSRIKVCLSNKNVGPWMETAVQSRSGLEGNVFHLFSAFHLSSQTWVRQKCMTVVFSPLFTASSINAGHFSHSEDLRSNWVATV